MKRLLISALIALGVVGCAPKNAYVIDGTLSGLNETIYMTDEMGVPIDSAVAVNGVFQFKGVADTARICYVGSGASSEFQLGLLVLVEPGTISIEGPAATPEQIVIGGTVSNLAMAAYSEKVRELILRYRDQPQTPENRAAADDEIFVLARTALEQNSTNLFGAMLLAQQLVYEMSPQDLIDAVAKFPASLRDTPMLSDVAKTAKTKLRTANGQPYIDVVQRNAQGEPVLLKSVIENPTNKYVLVDFWAAWCMPCMAEVPYLVEAYKTYHDKGFEIYGISFDTDKVKWEECFATHKMTWVQVSDLKRFDNQAARDYAVNSIPANFLIECATGKIVASNLRGAALEKKLAELLK